MNKEIYFCVDLESYEGFAKDLHVYMATSYDGMERALQNNTPIIATVSLAHLSFDLLTLGYDIYLCYKEKRIKIEEGLELHDGYILTSPVYYDDADIWDCFKNGYFDEMLGIGKGGNV